MVKNFIALLLAAFLALPVSAGTISPVGGSNAFVTSAQNVLATAPYRSGRSYIASPPSAAITSTNTNTLTTDTVYCALAPINSQVTMTGMGFRTSSSNASAGAAVKFAIYSLDGSGLPASRLAQTTTGVSVTDSAASTAFTANFSEATTINPGMYAFCILPTAVTTAARSSAYSSANAWNTVTGGSSASNVLSGSPIMGYKTADGAVPYAGNFPATFGAATAITNISSSSAQQVPLLTFAVQ